MLAEEVLIAVLADFLQKTSLVESPKTDGCRGVWGLGFTPNLALLANLSQFCSCWDLRWGSWG